MPLVKEYVWTGEETIASPQTFPVNPILVEITKLPPSTKIAAGKITYNGALIEFAENPTLEEWHHMGYEIIEGKPYKVLNSRESNLVIKKITKLSDYEKHGLVPFNINGITKSGMSCEYVTAKKENTFGLSEGCVVKKAYLSKHDFPGVKIPEQKLKFKQLRYGDGNFYYSVNWDNKEEDFSDITVIVEGQIILCSEIPAEYVKLKDDVYVKDSFSIIKNGIGLGKFASKEEAEKAAILGASIAKEKKELQKLITLHKLEGVKGLTYAQVQTIVAMNEKRELEWSENGAIIVALTEKYGVFGAILAKAWENKCRQSYEILTDHKYVTIMPFPTNEWCEANLLSSIDSRTQQFLTRVLTDNDLGARILAAGF